jgi:outer membrane immunogenic protein
MELFMRKLVIAAAASALALGLAAPAFAQDGPPPADEGNFSGPRAGIILGYDRLQPGEIPNSDITSRNSADGLTYGGDIGYDFDTGRAVFGVEGEVTGSTAKVTNPAAANALGFGRVKAGRDLYAGVRAGFKVAPSSLLYAKAGYTNERLDLVAGAGDGTETGNHFNLDGYRVGAGFEQSLGRKAYAKVEYRYSNYGNARLEFPNGANTNNFGVDTDRHQVVAGVGVRF